MQSKLRTIYGKQVPYTWYMAKTRFNVCPGKTFVEQELVLHFYKTDATPLDKNWPDANAIGRLLKGPQKHRKNVAFWKRQWNKHGTCQTLTQSNYFKFVLNKYDDLS